MSENPTSSSREARRRTVGEVVTVWIRSFRFVRGTADYIVVIVVSPTPEELSFVLGALYFVVVANWASSSESCADEERTKYKAPSTKY